MFTLFRNRRTRRKSESTGFVQLTIADVGRGITLRLATELGGVMSVQD